jgi:hypothetical protein
VPGLLGSASAIRGNRGRLVTFSHVKKSLTAPRAECRERLDCNRITRPTGRSLRTLATTTARLMSPDTVDRCEPISALVEASSHERVESCQRRRSIFCRAWPTALTTLRAGLVTGSIA